jgi:hypothetical protein
VNNSRVQQDDAAMLLDDLDRIERGVMGWRTCLEHAIAGKQTGNHSLRVRLDNGAVKQVAHIAENFS